MRALLAIAGLEISTIDLKSLHSGLTWLSQRPHLFSGSISDNIRLGCPAATDRQITDAAQTAGAAEFLAALPDGYRTVLGERGRALSTGQRQRIALARLILRIRLTDPGIVLLDEPTTGLDLATESTVLASMRAELAGRTVVVATHRPAVLDATDRVLAVSGGRLTDRMVVPA